MTIKQLHLAAIPNDHNTLYRVLSGADKPHPLFVGKFATMPSYIKQSLVVGFDYQNPDEFIIYAKLQSCTFSSCAR